MQAEGPLPVSTAEIAGPNWLGAFLHEMLAFPNARHDDQVDSVSQFSAMGGSSSEITRHSVRHGHRRINSPAVVVGHLDRHCRAW
jgi:hypothetical protein